MRNGTLRRGGWRSSHRDCVECERRDCQRASYNHPSFVTCFHPVRFYSSAPVVVLRSRASRRPSAWPRASYIHCPEWSLSSSGLSSLLMKRSQCWSLSEMIGGELSSLPFSTNSTFTPASLRQ